MLHTLSVVRGASGSCQAGARSLSRQVAEVLMVLRSPLALRRAHLVLRKFTDGARAHSIWELRVDADRAQLTIVYHIDGAVTRGLK